MTYWSAILLGIIQGLAEFLPISSSGHLAILQNFLRIGDLENQMLFDVLLHLGTLGAVILAYHTELRGLCREGLAMFHIKKLRRGVKPDLPRRRLLLFLIAATLPLIPAALLNDWLDPLFYNTFFIGFALIMTGFLLLAADRFGHGNKTEKAMTLSDAMVIGLAQMIAVVPGLSRSGTTISAGLLRGFDRTFAVRFSFFLSIPAVLGANLL
ncbi:MAG: undecaprenyl-diphosphate phosphatase, partial [Clostridiales bacterium]|nr:undecaprenyl-diphosphate phosphatase [Clostridiales bacterium]